MKRTLLARAFAPFTSTATRFFPGVRILMYHRVAPMAAYDQLNVAPERFERQMAYLARHHHVVSLDDAMAALAAGGPDRPAVAVTFDDGYLDNLEFALPILQRHGVPATIFVTADFCGQARQHPRYAAETGRVHLDWDEVRTLAATPGISIGSHTLSHPFLSRLPTDDAWREIHASREAIAERTGTDVRHFCYPSGDATSRERDMARRAGYASAVTVAPGGNRAGTDVFDLRRTEVTDRDEAAELDLKLRGGFDPVHRVLHWRRERKFARLRAEARGS